MGDGDTYYDVLDVDPEADEKQVKAAYRRMSHRVHPDQGGSHALFRQVQEAYETLSDPQRRAEYDRRLRSKASGRDADQGNSKSSGEPADGHAWRPGASGSAYPPPPPPGDGQASSYPPPSSSTASSATTSSWFSRHPVLTVAIAGYVLLVLASSTHSPSLSLFGVLALIVAGIAGLGRHRAREREAYRRADMSSVDAMSGTAFEKLLVYLFEAKGCRVTHTGRRGDFGADVLLDDPSGRTVIQAKRWSGTVTHQAVQEVVAAKAQYGAVGAMVVTNSYFSNHAVVLARSNAVELWDRTRLSQELTAFSATPPASGASRFGSQLWAGAGVGLRALLTVLLALSSGRRVRVRSHTRRTRRR
jgi:restriction system protein